MQTIERVSIDEVHASLKDRKPEDVKALSEEYINKTARKIADPNKLNKFYQVIR